MGIVSTGGAWLPDNKLMYINVHELKAILLPLKSFVKTSHKDIKFMSENTTAIHFINKTATSHYSQKSFFSNSHSRETNTVADKESQSNHVDTEWMLQPKVMNLALEYLCFKPK